MSATEELKPCPFCGGEASVIGDSESGYAAFCPECIDGGHTEVGWYFTEADAADAWNTRYDPIDDARIVAVETSYIDIEQGEIITRFVPELAATEQVEELKMQLALAAADSMGGFVFAALAMDKLTQAIAYELNAALDGGECEFVGDAKYPPKCSLCGWQAGIYDCEWLEDGEYEYDGNFCKQCGARVRKAVKR